MCEQNDKHAPPHRLFCTQIFCFFFVFMLRHGACATTATTTICVFVCSLRLFMYFISVCWPTAHKCWWMNDEHRLIWINWLKNIHVTQHVTRNTACVFHFEFWTHSSIFVYAFEWRCPSAHHLYVCGNAVSIDSIMRNAFKCPCTFQCVRLRQWHVLRRVHP